MNNSNLWQNQPKKQKTAVASESILESLRTLGGGVGKTVGKDVIGKVGSDALTSLFGGIPKAGELKLNQPIELNRPEVEPQPIRINRPEMMRPPLVRAEEANLKPQIEAIRAELKMLAASLKSLSQEVQKAVSEVPVQPGIYHLNFMERLKSILNILREQIDDSRSWLALSTNRKKQKGYWGMFKKHGTQFGLSNERTIATQAG